MSVRLAIFDCDGTLVDGQANICVAMEAAFDRAALVPPPRPAIRRIVGLSLVEALAILLPAADAVEHQRLAIAYKDEYARLRMAGAIGEEPLFDGIDLIVAELAAAGWLLGVATGKSDRGLARVLAAHDLTRHFVTLQTADRHPSKPHPAMIEACLAETGALPQDTVMIGDTSFDIAMARAAGVRAVGVAWGYHLPAELVAAGAHVVVEQVADLPLNLIEASEVR